MSNSPLEWCRFPTKPTFSEPGRNASSRRTICGSGLSARLAVNELWITSTGSSTGKVARVFWLMATTASAWRASVALSQRVRSERESMFASDRTCTTSGARNRRLASSAGTM